MLYLATEILLVVVMFFTSVASIFTGSVVANLLAMPSYSLKELVRFEIQDSEPLGSGVVHFPRPEGDHGILDQLEKERASISSGSIRRPPNM